MRIVYLISRAKRTGPVNQAFYILKGLNSLPDVHATLITLSPELEGNTQLQKFKSEDIEVVQLGQPLIKTWKCVGQLKDYIKKNHVEVVHSSGYRPNLVNMLLKKYVKTVSTQRCLPSEIVEKFPVFFQPPFKKLYLKIIKRMDVLVTCSKALQKVFYSDYGIITEAVQNGVNTDFFVPSKQYEKEKLRKKLGLPSQKTIYVVLGRISKRKNVGLIIKAFLKFNHDNSQLLILGGGPLKSEMETLSGGDERITFTGSVPNPLDYLQASDILVSSSLAEGLPNTVLEAMACGLPSILSDIEPHKELILNNKYGVLFDVSSEDSLKAAFDASLSFNLEEMRTYIRERTVEEHSIRALARNYVDTYKKALL